MNIIQKILFNSFLKKLLDKIPLNGYKTVLGVMLAVAAGVMYVAPAQYQIAIQVLIEVLNTLGAQPPVEGTLEAGLVAILVGTIHKYLKKKIG